MDTELIVRLSRLVKGPFLERRREITKDVVKAGLSHYDINDEFFLHDLSINTVVSKFLILHTQCSNDANYVLLNSNILAQKEYLSLFNYVRIGFSL